MPAMPAALPPHRRALEPFWLTLALLALACAWDATRLDLPLARLAGSAAGFPWRDHWLLVAVLHEGGRYLSWLSALALSLAVWWPLGPWARLTGAQRLQLAVSVLLAALMVALLKNASSTSCPWDLAEFGGPARYVSHWHWQPDGGAGRCFPAGHASSGFSFFGGYFAFLDTDPVLARAWLAAAAGAGLAFGVAQQWRGAHFMSHTLWSAVVCWCTAAALHLAWPRGVEI